MPKFKLTTATDGNLLLEHHEPPKFIIKFKKGQFNTSQQVKEIDSFDDFFKNNFMGAPKLMREAGEYLTTYHPEVI